MSFNPGNAVLLDEYNNDTDYQQEYNQEGISDEGSRMSLRDAISTVIKPYQSTYNTIKSIAKTTMNPLEKDIRGMDESLVSLLSNMDPKKRDRIENLITTLEIGVPTVASIAGTPLAGAVIGPSTAGLGEFIRSKYIKGEPLSTSMIKSGTGVALDLLGSGVVKGATSMGKAALKSIATEPLGEAAKKYVSKDILEYTKPTSEEIEDITKSAAKSIGKLKKTVGEAVSESKAKAIENGVYTNRKPIRDYIYKILREDQIIPKKEKVTIKSIKQTGKNPNDYKIVDKVILRDKDIKKGVTNRPLLNKVLKETRKIEPKSSAKDLLDIVDNIDDHLSSVYENKLIKPGAEISAKNLSVNEKAALKIRKKINDDGIKKLEETLGDSKKGYADFMRILNSNNGKIKRALKSGDEAFFNMMDSAYKRGHKSVLVDLKELDNLMPKKNKFFDRFMNKIVNETLDLSPRLYPSKPGIVMKAMSKIPKAISSLLITGQKPQAKFLNQVLKTSSIQGANELFNYKE